MIRSNFIMFFFNCIFCIDFSLDFEIFSRVKFIEKTIRYQQKSRNSINISRNNNSKFDIKSIVDSIKLNLITFQLQILRQLSNRFQISHTWIFCRQIDTISTNFRNIVIVYFINRSFDKDVSTVRIIQILWSIVQNCFRDRVEFQFTLDTRFDSFLLEFLWHDIANFVNAISIVCISNKKNRDRELCFFFAYKNMLRLNKSFFETFLTLLPLSKKKKTKKQQQRKQFTSEIQSSIFDVKRQNISRIFRIKFENTCNMIETEFFYYYIHNNGSINSIKSVMIFIELFCK